MNKNIFIEGIPGAGKSTLLNQIHTAAPQLHVCREGDYSPVELAWCAWMTKCEYEKILTQYEPLGDEIQKNTVQEHAHYIVSYTKILTDIPGFHKHLASYEIYNGTKTFTDFREIIVTRYRNFSQTGYLSECSFFQNIMEELLLYHQLQDDAVIQFYRELYRQIDREHFLLLYLSGDRLEEQIRTIRKERCDQNGDEIWYALMSQYISRSPYGQRHNCHTFEDLLMHFRHRQQLELRVIREIIGDRAVILPAKEWKLDEVMAYMNVSGAAGD